MRSFRGFWTEVGIRCSEGSKNLLLFLLAAYRSLGAIHLGGACRFEPSCSVYAVEAVRNHRPHVAIGLILRRLSRCRPGGPWGFDPVPKQSSSNGLGVDGR